MPYLLRLKTILQSSYLIEIILIIIIILSLIISNNPSKSKYNLETKEITGKLISYQIDGDKFSFILSGKEKIKGTYYIKTKEEQEYLNNMLLGITLKLKGNINEMSNNTIPNTINSKKYYKSNKIYYTFNVDNYEVINKKINIIYLIKNMLIKKITTYKSKQYLMMFILGDKSLMDENTLDNYKLVGITHLFAISGMHITLLSTILLKFLKDKKGYIITIIFLILYLLILGIQVSALRSVLLFIIIYLNKEFKFYLNTNKCLFITVILMLIYNPYYIINTSFQYSSLISYFLIRYSHTLKGNYFVSLIKISLLSFLISLPITINTNYEINILSILNNIFFVPLVSFIIYPLSLLTMIFKPFDLIFFKVINILEIIALYAPKVIVIIPKINKINIIIYYSIIYLYLNTYNKKYLLLIILHLLIYKNINNYINNNTYIYYLDVKQGDSIVIKNKNKTILIDTGGKQNYKEKEEWKIKKEYYYTDNTITFLKSIGSTKINYYITSHGDYDHMGESIKLIKNFKVENIIFNCGTINNLEQELINKINNKYYKCIKEININKNIKLQFLNTKEYDNENDNSNVIYLKQNNIKLLFMGDAGINKEKDILDKYNIQNIDILKIGHHGSNTSSSKYFINTIKPKYSIISVGKNNRYGHPKDEVLNTLKNSKIYRTDLDGSIEIRLNKNGYKIKTCPP